MIDMNKDQTRRTILKGGLAVAGLGLLNVPEWVLPALAQGETVVPFTDLPANYNPGGAPGSDRESCGGGAQAQQREREESEGRLTSRRGGGGRRGWS